MNYHAPLSIIIPTLNEGKQIAALITYLKNCHSPGSLEIIVSDGQSSDNTVEEARRAGAKVVLSPSPGRAFQMNFGAAMAKAPILYFIHADVLPPKTFFKDITEAVSQGYGLGRYQTQFDNGSFLLKINAFFTRFDFEFCYGGDQTLFITRDIFLKVKGFNAAMRIMEDYDIVKRARPAGKYKILPDTVKVSARKYEANSWLSVQCANFRIMRMFENGASQDEMVSTYRELINYR